MALSHLNQKGEAHMVDVSGKTETTRTAQAKATILLSPNAFDALELGQNKKGDVLATSRIAGIMAAKKTADLIPLCHPLPISKVVIDFSLDKQGGKVEITSEVKTLGQTGVEMEALTAVSISALTLYDMLKAVDKSIQIVDMHLVSKTGGKSGDYTHRPKG